MTNVLSPTAKQQFFDNNGRPAAGYKLFTYEAGTTTKLDTYVSANGAANTNPIVLDYRGEANLWIPPNVSYKYVLAPPNDTDPPSNPVWTQDEVVSSQLITLWGGVDTGSANTYVLTYDANFSVYVDGILVYWIPSNTNTGGSNLNINGLGAVPILDSDGFILTAGDIIAGQITACIYRTGAFYLLSVTTSVGSFTGTLTGVSGTVTGNILYKIFGGMCTLYTGDNIVGTSTSATMTITGLPSIVTPSVQVGVPCEIVNDSISALGGANVGTGGSIIFQTYRVSGAAVIPSTFISSNNKGISTGWSITYPL